MEHFDFTLKLLSPAFIAGAMEEDKNHYGSTVKHRLIENEGLRIPSLRGVLRFWFRAKSNHLDFEQVKKYEDNIFGSTEFGQGIRIIPKGHDWNKMKVEGTYADGIGYLGYGPLYPDHGKVTSHHRHGYRDAIQPGSTFTFKAFGTEAQILELKKCLILLHLFGCIGSRSRRGWGSIEVISLKENILPAFPKEMKLSDWLHEALKKVWSEDNYPSTNQNLPKYSAFYKNALIGISKKSWNNNTNGYLQIMKFLYDHFQSIRNYRTSFVGVVDHRNEVSDFRSGNFNYIPKRIAFGMPYQTLSTNSVWGLKFKAVDSATNDIIERRSSPLFLKVFLAPDKKLYAVALFLKSSFLGRSTFHFEAEKRSSKNPDVFANMPGSQSFPGWQIIENDFLQKNLPDSNPNKLWNSIIIP